MGLKKMNDEIKGFINEATFISPKVQTKFLKLIEKHFFVKLKIENYLRVDITLKENGDIIMKDDLYKTSKPVNSEDELNERYNAFYEDVSYLLNKKEVNFDNRKKGRDIANLIEVFFITCFIILIAIYGVRRFLFGDFYSVIWLVVMIAVYLVPAVGNRVRDKYSLAYRFLKKIFKK